jgi:hypothetical protein
MTEQGPEFTKPTHRCPKCAGSSEVSPYAYDGEMEVCPTCAPYGPFGLVPAIVAIEASLTETFGWKERELRARPDARDIRAWLLNDAPLSDWPGGIGG